MINETLRKNINVDKPNLIPIFNLKEDDDAILKLALFKNSVEFDVSSQTLRLGAKTSKALIEQIEGFTVDKNNIDIELKNSILVPGLIEFDLEIKDTEGTMTSASFFITVSKKVLNDEAVEATNEFDTFTKTVDKIESDYTGLRRIIIDENQAASLQDQINNVNSSLDKIMIMIEKNTNDIEKLMGNNTVPSEPTIVSTWRGKTASFYGDSLTEVNYHYTKGYHQWIKEILELNSYNNYGQSGYTLTHIYSKINEVTDNSDLIIVMGGVNDQNFSVPLGTIDDNTTSTTPLNDKLFIKSAPQQAIITPILLFLNTETNCTKKNIVIIKPPISL